RWNRLRQKCRLRATLFSSVNRLSSRRGRRSDWFSQSLLWCGGVGMRRFRLRPQGGLIALAAVLVLGVITVLEVGVGNAKHPKPPFAQLRFPAAGPSNTHTG